MLNGRDQMPFAEAVTRIKEAKMIGWGQMADKLRAAGRPRA
ncbi:hypothetical protein [uncultured Lamprocystis sp.]|jgi:hypothetical protein|nr:hypothetical protein [uncultured Lamprocystis sp.]